MIRITIEKKEAEISFDIDTNFRTAILGENGIGKTSILESILGGIAIKPSKHDWLSADVPRNLRVVFLSQIETNTKPLSGGEQAKKRLEALFSQKADLYMLDEPTNNLDTNNIEWLKQYIVKNKLPIIFTSHDINFIDDIAEVIFYLDSKGVEKTKEKCSSYLTTRKQKVEHAFLMYETNLKKQKELLDAARKAKQHGELGSKWKGTDNDKFLKGFNRNAAGKSAATASKLKERAEEMRMEKPKTDPIPNVSLTGNRLNGYLFNLATTVLSKKRIDLSVKSGDKILITGTNGVGKTTLMKYVVDLIEGNPAKIEDTFSKNGKFSSLYLSQDWYERLDNQTIEAYLQTYELKKEEMYQSLSFNHLDKNILGKHFKEISPGMRIKILLGALSCRNYDLIFWDEPTNHLDVMTQLVLLDAFLRYAGGLILISHDKMFLEEKRFTIISL